MPEGLARSLAVPGARQFTDCARVSWVVREVSSLESLFCPQGCLIFESRLIARRVRNYPEDWYRLEGPDLERLSWER